MNDSTQNRVAKYLKQLPSEFLCPGCGKLRSDEQRHEDGFCTDCQDSDWRGDFRRQAEIWLLRREQAARLHAEWLASHAGVLDTRSTQKRVSGSLLEKRSVAAAVAASAKKAGPAYREAGIPHGRYRPDKNVLLVRRDGLEIDEAVNLLEWQNRTGRRLLDDQAPIAKDSTPPVDHATESSDEDEAAFDDPPIRHEIDETFPEDETIDMARFEGDGEDIANPWEELGFCTNPTCPDPRLIFSKGECEPCYRHRRRTGKPRGTK